MAFIVAHRQQWGTIVLRGVTDRGSSAVLIPVAVGRAAVALADPAWRPAVYGMVAVVLVAMVPRRGA